MSENKVRIAGLVYGDCNVTKQGNLVFHHSIRQKDYALYKSILLESLGFKILNPRVQKLRPGSFSTNDGFIVSTSATMEGKRLRELFYPNGKKNIPVELVKDFNWDDWAILYQDNGRLNKSSHINVLVDGKRIRRETPSFVNRYEICLGYPTNEQLEALSYSLSVLGVESWVLIRKKDGQRNLVISKKDSKIKFFKNIKHRVHKTMSYKIDIIPTLDLLK